MSRNCAEICCNSGSLVSFALLKRRSCPCLHSCLVISHLKSTAMAIKHARASPLIRDIGSGKRCNKKLRPSIKTANRNPQYPLRICTGRCSSQRKDHEQCTTYRNEAKLLSSAMHAVDAGNTYGCQTKSASLRPQRGPSRRIIQPVDRTNHRLLEDPAICLHHPARGWISARTPLPRLELPSIRRHLLHNMQHAHVDSHSPHQRMQPISGISAKTNCLCAFGFY